MLILIQSRMNSKRLPKKVLKKINNKELLKYMIERILLSKNKNKIVVATSVNRTDNPIVSFCKKNKINYYRGSLNNVTERLIRAARKFKYKYFIRISGDSPLIDPKIIDKLIFFYKKNKNYDLISNRLDNSVPPGQTIEIIKTKSLIKAENKFKNKGHHEHVTKYFYENNKNFKIKNIKSKKRSTSIDLAVDNIKDFKKIKLIINAMEKDHTQYDLEKISKIYKNTETIKNRKYF
jgi:spore coat polysaccharide biosynthesis protein SpsF